MSLTREHIIAALRGVQDPELFKDIVTLNMVKDVRVDGGHVAVTIELTTPACPMKEKVESDVRGAILAAGATTVDVQMTANTRGPANAPAEKRSVLPQVKNVIAVGAGKGGVGKSTIATNIAIGLARTGATVGLMDGDIYGPSMPTMLGIKGKTPQVKGNKIVPFFVHGIHAITIGSLVEEEKPLIWRGPMAHGAFKQLLTDNTEWPALDYLIVDLPPGTGDVPLTLCQLLPLTGAVVVATPQQVALDDAVRAVRMFQQLGAPILGLVENMSYFVGPDGTEHDIFGRGGTEKAAQRLGLNYLGALPMFTALRVNSDSGKPNANFEGEPKLADALMAIVKTLAGQVSLRNLTVPTPTLNVS
ncbi:Mrp/NBP35 family ATP-binding protein [Humisphaera borealis]|uniref:Iron-sulfur cluster carrier protein n=1 Tax=Humisphaera borealis TaxID=2807512 RepID=A0A7M2X093_9BACT|nr:Mrp/NBP35 family ATP-binding protein [Humisphaera borealis]QOV91197.1 Mrp/NBP35 family ATP-binding protein [Humisphaera borealis]